MIWSHLKSDKIIIYFNNFKLSNTSFYFLQAILYFKHRPNENKRCHWGREVTLTSSIGIATLQGAQNIRKWWTKSSMTPQIKAIICLFLRVYEKVIFRLNSLGIQTCFPINFPRNLFKITQDAESGIFVERQVHIRVVDALAPCIPRSSVALVLMMYDKQILVVNEDRILTICAILMWRDDKKILIYFYTSLSIQHING